MAEPGQGFYPYQAVIEGYGNGGFRFAEMSHRGSLLCLPSGMHAWAATTPAEITVERLAPVFAVADHPSMIGWGGLAGCVAAGIAAGVLSALLTNAVYASEDAFHKLPIHWMWWPPIGGLIIGLGGLIFPQAKPFSRNTLGKETSRSSTGTQWNSADPFLANASDSH